MTIRSATLTSSISRNAGGLFEGVRQLVRALIDCGGIEERVFGVRDAFTESDLGAWRPAAASVFEPIGPRGFGYCPDFLDDLLAFNPDLTHTHGLWNYPSVAATVCSRKRRRPYIVSPHGMLDQWAIRNSRWKKMIAYSLYEGRHLRGAACLRALCEEEARSIRRFGLKNPIAIIPNGVNVSQKPVPKAPPWNGSVEPGKKVLLFLGRLHRKKGLANLLKAWNRLHQNRDSNWMLIIAGWDDGGYEQKLKCLATELDIPWSANQNCIDKNASVIFLGPQFGEAKAACYHFSDAFILPSLSEGLPMAVLEAWANSKPVLMTNECNLRQGFGLDAALRIETNPEKMACTLNEFFRLSDRERQAMGEKAASLVAKNFAWPRIAMQMKKTYEWMLGGGLAPECLADF